MTRLLQRLQGVKDSLLLGAQQGAELLDGLSPQIACGLTSLVAADATGAQ
jgi:hypothetical protein